LRRRWRPVQGRQLVELVDGVAADARVDVGKSDIYANESIDLDVSKHGGRQPPAAAVPSPHVPSPADQDAENMRLWREKERLRMELTS
jgi:hypothetical protein